MNAITLGSYRYNTDTNLKTSTYRAVICDSKYKDPGCSVCADRGAGCAIIIYFKRE